MATNTRSINSIVKVLGYGVSNKSIISSVALAVNSLFYIYTIGSYLKVPVFIIENRVSYRTFFNFYVIDRHIDQLIIISTTCLWLALCIKGKLRFVVAGIYGGTAVIATITSVNMLLDILVLMAIPVIIFFWICDRSGKKKFLIRSTNLSLNYLMMIGILISAAAIIMLLARLFSIPSLVVMPNYAYSLFVLLSSFSTFLIFLLILSFPVKLLIKEMLDRIPKLKNISAKPFRSNGDYLSFKTKTIWILLIMLFSSMIVLIPHVPTFNIEGKQIGVDTPYYVKWVNSLNESKSLQELFENAFSMGDREGDRPFILLFLFVITKITGSELVNVIEYIPAILAPLLVLAIYFLTREITSNDSISLLASFMTAVSFQTLIGVYAGFYANWFALIIGYLSFVFLLRYLKKSGKLNILLYSALVIILPFGHSYTWSVMVLVMCLFLLVMLRLHYYPTRRVIILLLVVVSSVIVDVARINTSGTGGIIQDLEVAQMTGTSLQQFYQRWSNLANTVQYYYGSQFSNFIILSLAIYWLVRCNMHEQSTIFLMVFLSVGIAPLFFGNWVIQSKVFYDIPFQIPAAIGLGFIKEQINRSKILNISVCLWLTAVSMTALSRFS